MDRGKDGQVVKLACPECGNEIFHRNADEYERGIDIIIPDDDGGGTVHFDGMKFNREVGIITCASGHDLPAELQDEIESLDLEFV